MIEITNDIVKKYPAVFKIARRDKMRVVWLENDLAYVARRPRGHGRYAVTFLVRPDGRVLVDCHTTRGKWCDGMQFKGLCAHAAKVILRGIPKKRKQAA